MDTPASGGLDRPNSGYVINYTLLANQRLWQNMTSEKQFFMRQR
eukprot:COSAG03_NODE_22_length_20538_cov_27.667286_6_plen_44_part_00